jgi:hypothetical protein
MAKALKRRRPRETTKLPNNPPPYPPHCTDQCVMNIYTKRRDRWLLIAQRSNSLMGWGLETAEQSLAMATASAVPALMSLNLPISTIDQLLCKGIDIVEQRVPAVHLPPHLVSTDCEAWQGPIKGPTAPSIILGELSCIRIIKWA